MPNTLGGPLLLAALILAVAYVLGRKFGRVRYTGPVGLLIIAALGFWYWDAIGEKEKWSRATATGERSLSVRYGGGSCEDQRSVDVDETDDSVKITITTRSFARGCDDALRPRKVTVKLNQPLGDRKLFDGACSPACVRPSPSTSQENADAVTKVADRIADLNRNS